MKSGIELEGPVWRSRRGVSRLLARGSLVAGAGPVALAIVLAFVGKHVSDPREHLALIGAVTWLVGWLGAFPLFWLGSVLAARRWRLGLCAIEIDASGVTLVRDQGTIVIPAGELTGALVVSARPIDELELTTRRGDVFFISVDTPADAHAAVDALGMGRAGRRVAVGVQDLATGSAAGCGSLFVGILAAVLVLFVAAMANVLDFPLNDHKLIPYFVGAVFVLTSTLVHKSMEGKRVVVGTDGVRVDGPFRERFVPRAAIASVGFDRDGTHLALKDGTKVAIGGTGPREQGLADRIEAALHAGSHRSEPPMSLLERGGRAFTEWRAALRALAAADPGYRTASYGVEALAEIACDAEAPVDRRIGAALALGACGDGEARARLRVAASGLASESLRIALEQAADGELEEAALEAAIEEAHRSAR